MEKQPLDNLHAEAHWRYGIGQHEKITWSPWTKNTICRGFGDLVGALIGKGTADSGIPSGFGGPLYIALGEGVTNGSWDFPNQAPPASNLSTTLVSEMAAIRKEAHVLAYRQGPPPDGTKLTYTEGATHFDRPIYTANWDESHALSSLGMREVGLFGGVNANTANSGLLLNVLRYPVQVKTADDPYTLYWEVEFKIVWE